MLERTVLIIESREIVRYGLGKLVEGCPELRLVGSANTLASGLRLIRELKPLVAATEIALSDSMGLETVRAVVEAQGARQTLVVSAHDELLYGEQVLALGASGYVNNDVAQRYLVPALLAVSEGQRWISPELNAQLLNRLLQRRRGGEPSAPALTARELQVLEHLKNGRSTKQIAAALGISARTVDLYRAQIKKKLGLRTSAELIAYASHHL
jgi:DNA-binding NarL/FixJ family response regulator